MIRKLIPFLLLYILVPAIIIPFISLKSGSRYVMFGIVFYFAGLLLARYKQWILLPIPILFCMWFWYTYGFGLKSLVTIYFVCLMVAVFLQHAFTEYAKFVKKVLPEQQQNMEYDANIAEMNLQIQRYKLEHPNEKITHELVEKIRTDIFFK